MDNMNFFEDAPMKEVTVGELQFLVKAMFEKRAEYEQKSNEAKILSEELETLKSKVLAYLQENNQTSFKVDGVGQVYTSNKYQVTMPKDSENAKKLRDYLLGTEGLEGYLTVNHQSLNSLYKSKVEEALADGRSISDALPGVSEPQVFTVIAMRKGK